MTVLLELAHWLVVLVLSGLFVYGVALGAGSLWLRRHPPVVDGWLRSGRVRDALAEVVARTRQDQP